MRNTKLELANKYFTAPQVRQKLGPSRFQLDLRKKRGILPAPTAIDRETGVRYFDENWLKAAELILANSIRADSKRQPEKGDQDDKIG